MPRIEQIDILVANVAAPGINDLAPAKLSDEQVNTAHISSEDDPVRTVHGQAMGPMPQIVVVTVHTEDGLEGHGFGWGVKGGLRLAYAIAEVYRPECIGEDVLDREKLWHKAHRADRFGGIVPFTAYGPLDVAFWDIGAKAAGVPLYKYIGAYRDRVPAYASSPFMNTPSEYADLAINAKNDGFTAFKLHPPGDPARDIECCRAVREAVGPEMVLMSDPVGGAYDHEDALKVGRALERLDFLWLEEPLYDHDIHGLELLSRTLDIPICAGEWNSDFFSKVNYLKTGAADIIRADVSWTGGVTGTLKTAHLAEAFGVNCEIHMTVLSLMDVANLHVALAIKNCRYLELPYPDRQVFGVEQPLWPDSDGMVSAPDGLGLGALIDWNAIETNTTAKI